MPHLATLIGDVIGSRTHVDRPELQVLLNDVLSAINASMEPVQPLRPTIGDEFQGAFAEPAMAIFASLVVRLRLLELAQVDSRYGVGWGSVTIFDAGAIPASQDGPGWWSARMGIDSAKTLASAPRTSFVRTCMGEYDAPGPIDVQGVVNAFLLCRDATVARMNPRQRRLLRCVLEGFEHQGDLAEREGITQSAVSQNLRGSGAYAIVQAHRLLEGALQ